MFCSTHLYSSRFGPDKKFLVLLSPKSVNCVLLKFVFLESVDFTDFFSNDETFHFHLYVVAQQLSARPRLHKSRTCKDLIY